MKSKFPVPDHAKQYWLDNWQSMTCKDLGKKFGYDGAVVNRYLKKQGVTIPRSLSYQLTGQKSQGKTRATPDIDQAIKDQYLRVPIKALARQLGVSDTLVKGRLKHFGLTIPAEIIEQRKRDSYIKTGNIPVNKGKKWDEYLTSEQQEKSRKTTFKKGDIPHNAYNEIGKVVIRAKKDGTEKYKFICIKLGEWVLYHQHVWGQHFGEVPDKHVIRFKDGDPMNCDVENLECVTMAENLRLNSLQDTAIASRLASKGRHGLDPELRSEILNNHSELIEVRRAEMLLKHEIKKINNEPDRN
ncbi:HNH endonuclease [Sphingobacterium multivorum]|uniref:HNH endonuclease n=1 Tax=Sphingobacterium multivorum TaxID=28454 RepID=UPI003DA47BB9